MKFRAKYFLFCLFFPFSNSFAQSHKIDSLCNVLKTQKEDTSKVNTLNALAYSLFTTMPDSTILLAEQASALATKLGWEKGEANAYNNAGIAYGAKGNYAKSLDYCLKALKMAEEIGDKNEQASILVNLGAVYYYQGNYIEAIEYDLKALKIEEEIGNKKLQAKTLGNIGVVYMYQGDYIKALDYDLKALKLAEELENKNGIAADLGNIGLIYFDQGEYHQALEYYMKALQMGEEMGNKQLQLNNLNNIGNVYYTQVDYSKSLTYYLKALQMGEEMGNKQAQGNAFGNIGSIYNVQEDYTKALGYFLKGLKLAEEIGDKSGIANHLGNIGAIYTKTGKLKEAEEYLKKAIALDSSIGEQNYLKQAEESISRLYDTTGRFKLALMYYKKAMMLKDTLFNIDKNKALTRKELTYQFDKKEAVGKAEQDKKDALAEADKRKQRIITRSVLGGLLLVLAFAGFIFRSLRITRRQKQDIENKNKVIEEKNKDILDSITYAKRLQDAILPPLSLIKQNLPESFVLYKPKDIVAGDFYWMESVGDTLLMAAADCTGHGVPGALVSVVCSNALNRTVKEFKITDTGKILDKVRELVLETFEKSNDNVQDGMDISLFCLNIKTNEAQWSGAYNSLWYFHKGEIIEVAADKQPIGKNDKPLPFNTHKLNLQKSDILYLFTDGYADQFGGPKGKKFNYKQLQGLLLANAEKPMDVQKKALQDTLEGWKGGLEQVDDILVIGIRV